MAGVVAALIARDHVERFAEQVDDFPFSFVAPLHTNNSEILTSHRPNVRTPSLSEFLGSARKSTIQSHGNAEAKLSSRDPGSGPRREIRRRSPRDGCRRDHESVDLRVSTVVRSSEERRVG